MITAYHRPQSLDLALKLIARSSPRTVPLGGGTLLSRQHPESIEVVDLQALGLDQIHKQGTHIEVGATVTLQSLLEHDACSAGMQIALKLEAPINLRDSATVAGTVVVCDGRSPFGVVLLALDAKISIMNPNLESVGFGDLLARREEMLRASLIIGLEFPGNARLSLEYVSRTPADKPIVCVALAQWPSGRIRVAVGGFGATPTLASDGPDPEGVEAAVRNALHDSSDHWGSAEYRMEAAATLARRCIASIGI